MCKVGEGGGVFMKQFHLKIRLKVTVFPSLGSEQLLLKVSVQKEVLEKAHIKQDKGAHREKTHI